MDLQAKTPTFDSISGKQSWEVQDKVENALYWSVTVHKISEKRWSVAPKHTFSNTRRIRRIKQILAQKCGQDPPFHTRRGPRQTPSKNKMHVRAQALTKR